MTRQPGEEFVQGMTPCARVQLVEASAIPAIVIE